VIKIDITTHLTCPKCNNNSFEIKREATYVYTYHINTIKSTSLSINSEALPYLFNNREQKNIKDYLLCKSCGAQYPCSINNNDKNEINLTILQKALRSNHQENPEYLG
jgi:uncharacterized protein YbaR (Trm112 family)